MRQGQSARGGGINPPRNGGLEEGAKRQRDHEACPEPAGSEADQGPTERRGKEDAEKRCGGEVVAEATPEER